MDGNESQFGTGGGADGSGGGASEEKSSSRLPLSASAASMTEDIVGLFSDESYTIIQSSI